MPIKSSHIVEVSTNKTEGVWSRGKKRSGNMMEKYVIIGSWSCPCGFQILEREKKLFEMKKRLHKKTCKLLPTYKSKGK